MRTLPQLCLGALLLTMALPVIAQDDACRERVGAVAREFGQALRNADSVRGVLPARGKVRLHLIRLGAEDGYFSSGQVDALLQDFLARGTVKSFEVERIEAKSDDCAAVVTCRVTLTDRDGRPARVGLRLSIQPEEAGWVVREIRESQR